MMEGKHDREGYQGGAGRSQDEDENRDHAVDDAGFFAHELSMLARYGRVSFFCTSEVEPTTSACSRTANLRNKRSITRDDPNQV